MAVQGTTASVGGQNQGGEGLNLIRSIAESTGPQGGASRPRFFIRPANHALQNVQIPANLTQTQGPPNTQQSAPQMAQAPFIPQPIGLSISQIPQAPQMSQQFEPQSSQRRSPPIQQSINQSSQRVSPPKQQSIYQMPQAPQMSQQFQLQSSQRISPPIQQSINQSSQRVSPPKQQSSQRISPPILQSINQSSQRVSPPKQQSSQRLSPPILQSINQSSQRVSPPKQQSISQRIPPPILQQQMQQQRQQTNIALVASRVASDGAVYHQSLQQDRMFQSAAPNTSIPLMMSSGPIMAQNKKQKRKQNKQRKQKEQDKQKDKDKDDEEEEDEEEMIMNKERERESDDRGKERNKERNVRRGGYHQNQQQHQFSGGYGSASGRYGSANIQSIGAPQKRAQGRNLYFEQIEAAEESSSDDQQAEDRFGLLEQGFGRQQAAALQEDLLFVPNFGANNELRGQIALQAVGHVSSSGTFLPFPADFVKAPIEGQSILQPPLPKINPIPFEQRLQQFKQSLMQYVQQYQQQGRAGQRQGQQHMWGFENNTGNIILNVKRGYSLVQSSFDQFMSAGVGNWKDNLVVQFDGEQGQDLGGVRREWYSIIIPSITNPDYGLFAIDSDNDNRVSVSHLAGSAQEEAGTDINQFFRFVGAVIGKAVTDGITVQAPFTRFLFKTLLGQEAHVSDVASHDPELTTQLKQMEQDDVTDYNIPFSLNMDFFGEIREIELVNGGANIAVNNDNKLDFIALCANHRLVGLTAAYMAALRRGFLEVIPVHLLDAAQLTPEELELILCGRPQIDIDDWEQNTNYQEGFTKESPTVQWFWDILKNDLNEKQRGDLLAFTTGSRRPPAQGFKAMIGNSIQDPRLFTIRQRVDFTANQLPVAHTCFNLIDFPAQYENKDQMKAKLLQALETLPSGFTIA